VSAARHDTAGHETAGHETLHALLMDLVRMIGLLEPEELVPGVPMSLSEAFAVHELDREPPMAQRDLAERLRLEKSTVSRLVAALERNGMLVRERDPGNRRLVRLRLTEAGHAAHARVSAAFSARHVQVADGMTADERKALATGLTALLRVLDPPAS